VEGCQSCNFPFFKGRIFYNYLHRRNKNKKSSFAGANCQPRRMELSPISTCTGFHHIHPRPTPLSFPLTPRVSTTTTTSSGSQRSSAAAAAAAAPTLVDISCNDPQNGCAVDAQRRHSKPYLARKNAILQVQQSPHLDSALQRSFLCFFILE